MSDRLSELQHQRALIEGHLAWLDREIAAATGRPAAQSSAALPIAKPTAPVPVSAEAGEPLADDLIARYGAESKNTAESVKKGCFVFFALALVLLCAGVYGLYLYSRSLHEHDVPRSAKPAHDSPETR